MKIDEDFTKCIFKVSDHIDLSDLEKFGFEYTENDDWCGTDAKQPRYKKDGLLINNMYYGVYFIFTNDRILRWETEWWYNFLDSVLKREIDEMIKLGIIEKIGNIYDNPELY